MHAKRNDNAVPLNNRRRKNGEASHRVVSQRKSNTHRPYDEFEDLYVNHIEAMEHPYKFSTM